MTCRDVPHDNVLDPTAPWSGQFRNDKTLSHLQQMHYHILYLILYFKLHFANCVECHL
jgi:hypothetical protein